VLQWGLKFNDTHNNNFSIFYVFVKTIQMPEDYFYEEANLTSVGLTLQELLEYYRGLCEQ
jgi:hypothetical protein